MFAELPDANHGSPQASSAIMAAVCIHTDDFELVVDLLLISTETNTLCYSECDGDLSSSPRCQ